MTATAAAAARPKPSHDRAGGRPPAPWRRLWRLGAQYGRFGVVGGAALATHVTLFVTLIEVVGLAPLIANVAAFAVAVLVSFFGHFHWSFRPDDGERAGPRSAARALIRFVVVALIGLGLNSLAVHVVVDVLALPYLDAIILMVSVVPVVVFLLSKLWAFAP